MALSLTQLRQSGWLHAIFIAVLPYPLGALAARFGTLNFHAHPIAYTAMAMLATAISLMLLAKPGPLGSETLKRPETWLYGVLSAMVGVMSVWITVYVSATETTMLQRSGTIWVFVISFLFLGHRVSRGEWLGLSIIGIAAIYLLTKVQLDAASLIQLCLLLVIVGITQAIQKIVVETHKTNRAAQTFHQNMRVTAIVMGVTSALFLLLFLGLAYIKSLTVEPLWPSLPSLTDFLNWPMFVLTAVMGLLLHAPAKYCEFYSSKKISAKYLMAVLTLQPVFTAFYESILEALGLMHSAPMQTPQYIALMMVVAGSLWLAFSGFRQNAKGEMKNNDFVFDPTLNATIQQTVRLTMSFTKGNQAKAARLLGIDVVVLKEIIADKEGRLQFTRDLARRIESQFATHVAMADPLTGLANRLQFTTALTQRLKGRGPLYLALVDLNHFKPVNDTYGHAAGDHLLQLVAKRLQKLSPRGATIARLGGDEFALFSTTAINAKSLQAGLAAPYKTKHGSLTVPGAIGIATAPKDGKTPETLLAVADKRLYTNKHNAKK